MTEHEITATPPLKNRRPGLIGCGIVYVLFGMLFVGFALMMTITFVAGPPGNAQPMPSVTNSAARIR